MHPRPPTVVRLERPLALGHGEVSLRWWAPRHPNDSRTIRAQHAIATASVGDGTSLLIVEILVKPTGQRHAPRADQPERLAAQNMPNARFLITRLWFSTSVDNHVETARWMAHSFHLISGRTTIRER